jgi:hypothetical protein
MTAAATKLTPARRRALDVLAAAQRDGHAVRVSNETNNLCVYWQSAGWLESSGLATITHGPTGEFIQLTDAGRHVAGAS